MADGTILTKEGREEKERELERLKTEVREHISEQLREARGFGDFSENAELDAARDAYDQNESRIRELERELRTAKSAEDLIMSERGLVAAVGTQVLLEDERGKSQTFSIVGTTETDSLRFKISNESPIGAALIGHTAGDQITFTTPAGKVRQYTLVEVKLPGSRRAAE